MWHAPRVRCEAREWAAMVSLPGLRPASDEYRPVLSRLFRRAKESEHVGARAVESHADADEYLRGDSLLLAKEK